jgi:hypothetical protein
MRILALAILATGMVLEARRPGPRRMIRTIRSACKSTKAGMTTISNADIPRWHSAICQHQAAPPNALSTRITQAQKRRRDDETGRIGAFIELIPSLVLSSASTGSSEKETGARGELRPLGVLLNAVPSSAGPARSDNSQASKFVPRAPGPPAQSSDLEPLQIAAVRPAHHIRTYSSIGAKRCVLFWP